MLSGAVTARHILLLICLNHLQIGVILERVTMSLVQWNLRAALSVLNCLILMRVDVQDNLIISLALGGQGINSRDQAWDRWKSEKGMLYVTMSALTSWSRVRMESVDWSGWVCIWREHEAHFWYPCSVGSKQCNKTGLLQWFVPRKVSEVGE